MRLYFSWVLLLPVALSVLYGYMQYRSAPAMGVTRRAKISWLLTSLSGAGLTVAWSMSGFMLPVFFILAYLLRAARHVRGGLVRRKVWFLLNLSYINTMALHLALIGAASLVQGVTMHALLASGFWRTMSVTAVLTIDFLGNLVFLKWPDLPSSLSAEADSEEARPFMAFLWFCTGYLLVDSFLCVAELEPLYPPLFLIGSIAVLMYFITRFLLHIHAIIRDEYLKEEHDLLSSRLKTTLESAGALKRIVDLDALTGAVSRRRIMEQIDALIEAGTPFCLAFLDLDGLKRINDSVGHEAGDRYLIGFAKAMEARLSKGDQLARVGGDEFVLLMPGCDAGAARRRVEGIRAALEAHGAGETAFRFSYGVSAFPDGGARDALALLEAADHAMYQDKERRR